jgi:hypothetical protein
MKGIDDELGNATTADSTRRKSLLLRERIAAGKSPGRDRIALGKSPARERLVPGKSPGRDRNLSGTFGELAERLSAGLRFGEANDECFQHLGQQGF